MLDWIACLLAPRVPSLLEQPTPALPDPAPDRELADRAARAFDAVQRAPFRPTGTCDPYKLLLAMGCRDLVRGEADQHPDSAGRTPNYRDHPAFQPVEIPLGAGRPTLTGRRSTGAPGAPVVIVVHGLFDSHVAGYVVDIAESLRRMGFHTLALDLRDHGLLRGREPPPSLGIEEGRDLFLAARALSRAEGVSVGLLGLSYGAHCVVRAAHEAGLAGEPDVLRGGVLAVAGPYDLLEAVLAIDEPERLPRPERLLQRLVFRALLSSMSRHLTQRLREHRRPTRRGAPYQAYIEHVVQPRYAEHGATVEAFLRAAGSARPDLMSALRVPTLLLHSSDDPLVPVRHLQRARAAAGSNPWVAGRELPSGGHVCLGAVDPAGTLGLLAAWFGTLRDG